METLGGKAAVPRLPEVAASPTPTGEQLDRLVAIAWRTEPALDIREIRFMKDNGVVLLGPSSAWLVRDRANAVAIDPATGKVITTPRPI